MRSCPDCRGPVTVLARSGPPFEACASCETAWLADAALAGPAAEGAYFHSFSRPAKRPCASCGGPRRERTLLLRGASLDGLHCQACTTFALSMAEVLRSGRPQRERKASHATIAERGATGRLDTRTIDERDRIFAFLFGMPLELSNDVPDRPPVVMTLMALCAAVFFFEVATGGEMARLLMLRSEALTPASPLRAATSLFVHFSIAHLLGNLYFFYAFGRLVEQRLGPGGMASLFLVSGLVSSAAFLALHLGDEGGLGGASGAIAGVVGCYLVLFPWRWVGLSLFFMVLRVPAISYLGLWFWVQVVSIPYQEGKVAFSGHAGGFVCGLVWGAIVRARASRDGSATP